MRNWPTKYVGNIAHIKPFLIIALVSVDYSNECPNPSCCEEIPKYCGGVLGQQLQCPTCETKFSACIHGCEPLADMYVTKNIMGRWRCNSCKEIWKMQVASDQGPELLQTCGEHSSEFPS